MKRSAAVALALFLGLAAPAWAQSTINTSIPASGGPVQSAPVRANFVAAASDINNLLGMHASSALASCPSGPPVGTDCLVVGVSPYQWYKWAGTVGGWSFLGTIDPTSGDFTLNFGALPTIQPGQVLGNAGLSAAPAAGINSFFTSAPTIYVNGIGAPATCAANSAIQSFTCAVGVDAPGNGTVAAPYRTLNYAISQTQLINRQGFTPTIVMAYGSSTNYGGVNCTGANVAGANSAIIVQGDLNSQSSVSMLSPNSGEGAYVSDYCAIVFRYFVCDNQGTAVDCIRVGHQGAVDISGLTCGLSWNSTTGDCLRATEDGTLTATTNLPLSVLGCGNSVLNMEGGVFNIAAINPPFTNRHIAISSAITCNPFKATGDAQLRGFSSATFTGAGGSGSPATVTGVSVALSGHAYVNTGGAGINAAFPFGSPATLTEFAATDVPADVVTTPFSWLGVLASQPITVNFGTAGDNAIATPFPNGFSQIKPFALLISQCTGSLSGATFGLNTATGGGGAALIPSGSVSTVTNNTANTNNNAQSFNTFTNQNTEAYTPANGAVQFRVGSTAAASCKIVFEYLPYP
jgi:hypothetical protein